MSLNVGARFNYYGHSTFLITTDGGVDLLLDPWVWLPDRSAGGQPSTSPGNHSQIGPHCRQVATLA